MSAKWGAIIINSSLQKPYLTDNWRHIIIKKELDYQWTNNIYFW
jgi:hypothetical protein